MFGLVIVCCCGCGVQFEGFCVIFCQFFFFFFEYKCIFIVVVIFSVVGVVMLFV